MLNKASWKLSVSHFFLKGKKITLLPPGLDLYLRMSTNKDISHVEIYEKV